ncbi:MAG: serine/threonine-protein kinase, partial [Acidobacteriota bacterium]
MDETGGPLRPENYDPHTETLNSATTLGQKTASTALRPAPGTLDTGSILGRYVLLGPIGRGGSGQVFAAYDPQLDRKVAVKVLRSAPDTAAGSPERLLREARALARLQHPNVLTIHDIGESAGRVFVATELLAGSTVAEWLSEGERPWTEVVEIFVGVAQGLAAAHAQGLVHRDVKPSNMMISGEGEGLLVDFGIARDLPAAEDERGEIPLEELGQGQTLAASRPGLDRGTGRAGTPAFMAPEQKSGGEIGPAADQYAFCVALHWALGRGVLPGAAPLPDSVPAALERLIARGLAADPADRHASMEALAQRLLEVRDRWRQRYSRRLLAGGVAALGAGVIWALAFQSSGSAALASCSDGRDPMAALWNPEARSALHQSLAGREPAVGPAVWQT